MLPTVWRIVRSGLATMWERFLQYYDKMRHVEYQCKGQLVWMGFEGPLWLNSSVPSLYHADAEHLARKECHS